MIKPDEDLIIFIISDSVGKTAENVINAVTSQFETNRIEIKKFNNVTNIAKLSKVINKALEEDNVLLAYTIILPELCKYIESEVQRLNLPSVDLIGPAVNKISDLVGQRPEREPGLNRRLDQEYFKRIDCIEFAVRCDDGKNISKLDQADFVLIGISRTSKTPLSMYLANQGYKPANIPLVPEVTPPQELYELPSKKVVGLTIDPDNLRGIREERLRVMNFNKRANYARVNRILEELTFAEEIMKKVGCMVVNVTNKSIEETASKILAEANES
ncbi:kinase/pyrophosphorylase [Natroniella sulfidigena]|uniref:pyruvate, water dikinase regulatory protein n=1 Tax=Natroniella sulfidigena TaxID=723921 RepID=UPI00200B4BE5|nr:pyruvate, water dikinase regulatory protein [Natroniella sulfidigena]MCK8815943.1 kinase/pyrophosphorylase [Natroniella sulfidigena]